LSNYQEVFAALDNTDWSFFVAAEVTESTPKKLTAIAHGILPFWITGRMKFDDHLQCIWEAYKVTYFTKFYFKLVNWDDKYIMYLYKSRLWGFILEIVLRDCPWTFFPAVILYYIFCFAFLCFCYFPIYHAKMAPFYLLSIPFEYFLFQNNVVFNVIITKTFIYFWILPASLSSFWYYLWNTLFPEIGATGIQIQPDYLKKAVIYQHLKGTGGKQYRHYITCSERWAIFWVSVLYHFVFGFIYSLPFSPFMMIPGESNK